MEFSVQDVLEKETIRTGLRPYGQFLLDLSSDLSGKPLLLQSNFVHMYLSRSPLVICSALLRFAIAAVLGGVPLIGPVPEVDGLMLATGHEGSGLCMVCFPSYSICMYSLCVYSIDLS